MCSWETRSCFKFLSQSPVTGRVPGADLVHGVVRRPAVPLQPAPEEVRHAHLLPALGPAHRHARVLVRHAVDLAVRREHRDVGPRRAQLGHDARVARGPAQPEVLVVRGVGLAPHLLAPEDLHDAVVEVVRHDEQRARDVRHRPARAAARLPDVGLAAAVGGLHAGLVQLPAPELRSAILELGLARVAAGRDGGVTVVQVGRVRDAAVVRHLQLLAEPVAAVHHADGPGRAAGEHHLLRLLRTSVSQAEVRMRGVTSPAAGGWR